MRIAGSFFAALALAACSQPASAPEPSAPPAESAPPATDQPVAAIPTPPTPAPAEPTATLGGDGSEITLNPLTAADLHGVTLEGELACSFAAEGSAPLILARGDVASKDPAFGLVKVGESVERIHAAGGYDGMVGGGVFSGPGKTITIAVTGAPQGDGESPPRPATLTYDRADGAKRLFPGIWTCGP